MVGLWLWLPGHVVSRHLELFCGRPIWKSLDLWVRKDLERCTQSLIGYSEGTLEN